MLTRDRALELVRYDPETGLFAWAVARGRNGNRVRAGEPAGSPDGSGYIRVTVDGVKHRAHRLAFLLMTGDMPAQVDHINGERSDNRWCNLRAADATVNARNAAKRRDGKNPATGVRLHPSYRKWEARCSLGGKYRTIGFFDTAAEAIAARAVANAALGFHANHGRA